MAAKPDFDPRRAEPGQAFEYADTAGDLQHFRADDEGVVRPRNAEEARIADTFDLPVARTVKAEEKAEEK